MFKFNLTRIQIIEEAMENHGNAPQMNAENYLSLHSKFISL
jgi:hypothetical protein